MSKNFRLFRLLLALAGLLLASVAFSGASDAPRGDANQCSGGCVLAPRAAIEALARKAYEDGEAAGRERERIICGRSI